MKIEIHQCLECSYEFEWKFQVDRHVRSKHTNGAVQQLFHAIAKPEQFSCVCCNFKGYYLCDLYEHYKYLHHGGHIDENIKQKTSSLICDKTVVHNNFPCDHCSYKSDSCLSLANHINSCGKKALRQTKSTGGDRKKRIFKNWFRCAQCTFITRYKCNLKIHMRRHASSRETVWFECAKCSHKSKYKWALKTHMLKHASKEDIKWFHCTECSYKGKSKGNLKNHMLKHASVGDIDWFECAQCSFKSRYKEALKSHMLKHASVEDVDWFTCTKCSYKTKYKSTLKQHMLQHASIGDIVWFECTKCSFKTKYKYNLKSHMLKHASGKVDLTV